MIKQLKCAANTGERAVSRRVSIATADLEAAIEEQKALVHQLLEMQAEKEDERKDEHPKLQTQLAALQTAAATQQAETDAMKAQLQQQVAETAAMKAQLHAHTQKLQRLAMFEGIAIDIAIGNCKEAGQDGIVNAVYERATLEILTAEGSRHFKWSWKQICTEIKRHYLPKMARELHITEVEAKSALEAAQPDDDDGRRRNRTAHYLQASSVAKGLALRSDVQQQYQLLFRIGFEQDMQPALAEQ